MAAAPGAPVTKNELLAHDLTTTADRYATEIRVTFEGKRILAQCEEAANAIREEQMADFQRWLQDARKGITDEVLAVNAKSFSDYVQRLKDIDKTEGAELEKVVNKEIEMYKQWARAQVDEIRRKNERQANRKVAKFKFSAEKRIADYRKTTLAEVESFKNETVKRAAEKTEEGKNTVQQEDDLKCKRKYAEIHEFKSKIGIVHGMLDDMAKRIAEEAKRGAGLGRTTLAGAGLGRTTLAGAGVSGQNYTCKPKEEFKGNGEDEKALESEKKL